MKIHFWSWDKVIREQGVTAKPRSVKQFRKFFLHLHFPPSCMNNVLDAFQQKANKFSFFPLRKRKWEDFFDCFCFAKRKIEIIKLKSQFSLCFEKYDMCQKRIKSENEKHTISLLSVSALTFVQINLHNF